MLKGEAKPAVEPLHVLVGVIENSRGEILVAQRPAGKRFGGYWEFPGGKREAQESPRDALLRELEEELGLTVQGAQPLMRFLDPFAGFPILLDVWHVTDFAGDVAHSRTELENAANGALGREGQPLRWANRTELAQLQFPPANQRIFKRLNLSQIYGITPASLASPELSSADRCHLLQQYATNFLQRVRHLSGRSDDSVAGDLLTSRPLLQIRAHDLSEPAYAELCLAFAETQTSQLLQLVANRHDFFVSPGDGETSDLINNADATRKLTQKNLGLHMPEKRLRSLHQYFAKQDRTGKAISRFRQVMAAHPGPVGASCHGVESLTMAEQLGLDYALLSPVHDTLSHSGVTGMGWVNFAKTVQNGDLPVFALGGMRLDDLMRAKEAGAQGVAGISDFVSLD